MIALTQAESFSSPIIPIVDSLTAVLFGIVFLWGIFKARKETDKNKPKWGKGTTTIYAMFLLLPFLGVSLISLWFYKTLIISVLRLVCYSITFLVFKKTFWSMLDEISKPSFGHGGGFAVLMMSLIAFGLTGIGELAFRLLDWWLF